MAPVRHARSEDEHAPGDTRAKRQAERDASAATAVLRLQQAAGNQAVGRMLARRAAAPHQTGLRKPQAIERFVHKAVAFWQRNGDLRLLHYALYLGAAVNEELAAIGVPAVAVSIREGMEGAAGEFDAASWGMTLNPTVFTPRAGVDTMGQLTSDEAGIIAMRVYHEARHAEQNFRIARLDAGEHAEHGIELDDAAAAAAAAAPLDPRHASAQELREAREWRTNQSGADATYREAVTSWGSAVRTAARLARDVDVAHAADVRERLGRIIKGWRKPGAAAEYIRSHLADAQTRKAALVVTDITRMDDGVDRAEAAWSRLREDAQPPDFKPLADALGDLARAVYTAYRDQPVEHDAWDAGGATFDAFTKALPPGH